MKNFKLSYLLKIIFVLFFVTSANADILTTRSRPTMEEALAEFQNKKKNPFETSTSQGYEAFKKVLIEEAPRFIATLEAAHPGATFAFIGRDTQAISDVVEAFYLSVGQSDRVEHIGVSSHTLDQLTNEQIVTYLKGYRFDLKNINEGKPFILVDTVSKGAPNSRGVTISGRQGRRILQAVYAVALSKEILPQKLISSFNMIGLQVSTFRKELSANKTRYQSISKMKEIEAKNKLVIRRELKGAGNFGENLVLPLIPDKKLFNESGYDHHTGAWHEKFGKPRKSGTRLIPNPGALRTAENRKAILWLQYEIYRAVNTREFQMKVKDEFKKRKIKLSSIAKFCKPLFGEE